ncbi:MAG: branched-chain amino acid ABC transporter permease [Burkholderiales bacterium]
MANKLDEMRQDIAERERVERGSLGIFAWGFVALALAFAAVAAAIGDTFFFRLATEALIFGGLALAVDILLGYIGLLSLGQALFFGFGAYVSAFMLKGTAPTFWGALGSVLLSATVFGAVTGIIAIRARGVYFALITFGLAQVLAKVVFNTRELGASDGIIGIPEVKAEFRFFSVDTAHAPSFFLLVLAIVGCLYLLTTYFMGTPFGRTLAAIRANEERVPFLGFPVWPYKLAGFVLAADVAAICGALYPMLRGFVSPELMFFQVSGNAVIMVIIGGVGTLSGPFYGSAILTGLKSVIGTFTEHHAIVIGILFVLSVIFLPKGLVGYLRPYVAQWLTWRRRKF